MNNDIIIIYNNTRDFNTVSFTVTFESRNPREYNLYAPSELILLAIIVFVIVLIISSFFLYHSILIRHNISCLKILTEDHTHEIQRLN